MDTACRALESTVGKEKMVWKPQLGIDVSGLVLDLVSVAVEDTAVIQSYIAMVAMVSFRSSLLVHAEQLPHGRHVLLIPLRLMP